MALPVIASMIGSMLSQLAQQRQQQGQQDQENERSQQNVGLRDLASPQTQAPGSAPGSVQPGAGNGLSAVSRLTNAPAAQAEADRERRQLGAISSIVKTASGMGAVSKLLKLGGNRSTPTTSGNTESVMG